MASTPASKGSHILALCPTEGPERYAPVLNSSNQPVAYSYEEAYGEGERSVRTNGARSFQIWTVLGTFRPSTTIVAE